MNKALGKLITKSEFWKASTFWTIQSTSWETTDLLFWTN